MKKSDDEEYEFVMFCTMVVEGDKDPFLFAHRVTDEIDAVKRFNEHVEFWGNDHIPFIHMERVSGAMLDEWENGENEIILDPANNLFRVPPSMKDRVAG